MTLTAFGPGNSESLYCMHHLCFFLTRPTRQIVRSHPNWPNTFGNALLRFLNPLPLLLLIESPSWQHPLQRPPPLSRLPFASTAPLYKVCVLVPWSTTPSDTLPRLPPYIPQRRRRHNLPKPKRPTISQPRRMGPTQHNTQPPSLNRQTRDSRSSMQHL
jgi:hypothetical protein